MDAIRRRARRLVRRGKSDLPHPAKNSTHPLSTSTTTHTPSLISLQSTASPDPITAVAPHPGHSPSLQTGENGAPLVAESPVGHTNNSFPAQHSATNSEKHFSGQQGAHAPIEYIASSTLDVTEAPPQILTLKSTRFESNESFREAVMELAADIDPLEREQFLTAHRDISLDQTIQTVQKLEECDGTNCRNAKALGPAIRIIEQFMAGVSIAIQQSPDISSLAVGAVRFLIDTVSKFVDFYGQLSHMITTLADYLAPLETFSQNAISGGDIRIALFRIYCDLLTFFRQARLVFVNGDGSKKKLGTFRIFFRVQWQPFDEKFGAIKAKFYHNLSVLHTSSHANLLENSTRQSKLLEKEFSKAELERLRVREDAKYDERRRFLEWISKDDHELDFDRLIKQRHTDTGIWLLQDKAFREWEEQMSSSLLWCYGNPGAGKSVLASVVVDHITKYEMNEEKTCVVFAYYSYRHPDRDIPSNLVSSWIKQLCSKMDGLPQDIKDFFRKTYGNAKMPSLDDLIPRLLSLLGAYNRVFIVIDALDECQANTTSATPGRPKYRHEVLKLLKQLMSTAFFKANTKLFITSRPETDIKDAFKSYPVIKVDVDRVNPDIRRFLRHEIESRIEDNRLKIWDSGLREEILDILTRKAKGMFLWVSLQLDSISDPDFNDNDIRQQLDDLPVDLYGTYDRILEKINQKSPALQEVARVAFMWVLYAKRPLAVNELREAIAMTINPSIKTIEALHASWRDRETILSCAGNLLTFEGDDAQSIVRPIHETVQVYFMDNPKQPRSPQITKYFGGWQESHSQLAMTCMAYLQRDMFLNGPIKKGSRLYSRYYHAINLACYASYFFDRHIAELVGFYKEIKNSVDATLRLPEPVIGAVLECRRHRGLGENDSSDEGCSAPVYANSAILLYSTSLKDLFLMPEPHNLLVQQASPKFLTHQAARYNMTDTVLTLLRGKEQHELNEPDMQSKTPLIYAAENGYHRLATILLEFNAEVNYQHNSNGTALYHACSSTENCFEIVKLLLDHGADVNSQGGHYGTALQAASVNGARDIVNLLLKNGALINLQGGHYNTALQAASAKGASEIVKLLLQSKADVNLQGGRYNTALQAAVAHNAADIVSLLLENKADVNLQGGEYNTALQAAAVRSNLKTVKLLIEDQAEINLEGGYYYTPLQAASAWGASNIVKLLLKSKAQVDVQGGRYGTALNAAISRKHITTVQLLLSHGAKTTPKMLVKACGLDHRTEEMAFRLLTHGAEVSSAALEAAAMSGKYKICRALVDRGVQITPVALTTACLSYKTRLCKKTVEPDAQVFDLVALFIERGAKVTDEFLARFGPILEACKARQQT